MSAHPLHTSLLSFASTARWAHGLQYSLSSIWIGVLEQCVPQPSHLTVVVITNSWSSVSALMVFSFEKHGRGLKDAGTFEVAPPGRTRPRSLNVYLVPSRHLWCAV